VIQPVLGKAADSYSYATSFVVGAVFQLLAVPLLVRSRLEGAPADTAVTLAGTPPDAAIVDGDGDAHADALRRVPQGRADGDA
jgi:hypothetical protein